jgi:transposase
MRIKEYTSDLDLASWQRIESLITVRRRSKWPLQEVVNGILYVLKNGCGWRDLPGEFPCWNTVHYYFAKWGKDGTWENINACLLVDYREKYPTVEKKRPNLPPSSLTRKVSKTRPRPRSPSASMGAN